MFLEEECYVSQLNYQDNDNISLQLYTMEFDELMCTASVNTDLVLPDNYVAIKDYGENEGILDALIQAKVIGVPVEFIQSGFAFIPVCKFLGVI